MFIWVLNVSPYVLGGQSIIIILLITKNLQNVPDENNRKAVFSHCSSDNLESTSSIKVCPRDWETPHSRHRACCMMGANFCAPHPVVFTAFN